MNLFATIRRFFRIRRRVAGPDHAELLRSYPVEKPERRSFPMGLFDSIFGTVLPGLSGVVGLVEGLGAEDRAQRARQQAIADMQANLARDYQDLRSRNLQGLRASTGQVGDSISQLGRTLGSSLAGAGVYNSSATAGALAHATQAGDTALSNLGTQNFFNEQDLLNQNQRYLTGLKLNLGNQQYGEAQQQLGGSAQGLSSFLGTLGQFGLAQSGANQQQNGLSRQAGGYGNPSVLAPGAGMGLPADYGLNTGWNFNPNAFRGLTSGLAGWG